MDYIILLEIFILSSLSMMISFLVGKIIHNFAVVDFTWSFNFFLISVYLFNKLEEINPVQGIFLIMVSLWSLRLAFYLLFARIINQPEEGRYVRLRESWKDHLNLKFFLFYQFQALTNVILSIPFLLIFSQENSLLFNHYLGIFVFTLSLIGESISDFHLFLFKRKPSNHNKTLRTGLWRYSRHPNYFFELGIWLSYGIYHMNAPLGYLGFLSFFIILYFILYVTGIPATEEQNLKSKGKEYLDYIATTSPLIPMPPAMYQKYQKWKSLFRSKL
ncbi:MAG: DUF1295 domain-containing protein [Leptospiraceae bacterium]|nr:DUF1295 domain-containing protein [Leptospiraceae bacterium]MDW7975704.1 DUF1295 domain-containing protein [Leptospiraceae bacterium]